MKLYDHEKNAVYDAMRDRTAMEYTRDNVTLLVDEGGGPWGQSMICGAVFHGQGFVARQWCRTLEELLEFLEVMENVGRCEE